MALVLTEEQLMLKSSAREFLKNSAPVSALRKLRDDKSETGYDLSLWNQMTEMGWAALTISESYGGINFGYTGLGQILEETGKTLTASPLVSTVLLSSTLISKGGTDAQKERLLPAIGEGKMIIALASEETSAHRPHIIDTRYSTQGNAYVISGKKVGVLDGHVANQLIVSARNDGDAGVSLFLVDAQADGVIIDRTIMMDSRNAANVSLHNVKVDKADLIGEETEGHALLEKTMDIARIGVAAEMLGTMQEAFDRTVAYLKEREQFGVRIGSFQGLQHRAAIMYMEIENCRSLVLAALNAIDVDAPDLAVLASLTKAKLGETIKLVTNEAIQMYGGIGMTDDEEIGFFLKRARVAQQTLGDYNYHLDRYAKIKGY